MSPRVSLHKKIRRKNTWASWPRVFSSLNRIKIPMSQKKSDVGAGLMMERNMMLRRKIYWRDSSSVTHSRKDVMLALRRDLLAASLGKEYLRAR